MTDLAQAGGLAKQLLAETLPMRWLHVQGVASRAREIGHCFGTDAEVLAVASLLHDIGYSPELAVTGFHPLDGARYLRRVGTDERIVGLVAFHSCALMEAEERGLDADLAAEFDREQSAVSDALCYCDMTTGPEGQRLTVEQRLAEIQKRYGPGHLVSRFVRRAYPEIVAASQRTERYCGLAMPSDKG